MAEVIVGNSNNASSYGGHASTTSLKMQSSQSPSPPRSGPSTPESDQLRLHLTATASVVVPAPAPNESDIKRHFNNNNNDERSPVPESEAQAEADDDPEQMMIDDQEGEQERGQQHDFVVAGAEDEDNCNDEEETASSCGSEPDSGDGRLQIVLNNNNNNTISSKLVPDNEEARQDADQEQEREQGQEQRLAEDNMNMDHDGEREGEDEEDFYERYRQQQQQLYQQLTQQQQKQLFLQQYKQYSHGLGHSLQESTGPASAAPGGLTVTKFPINGHARSGGSGSSNAGKHGNATVANNLNASTRISPSPESAEPGHGLGQLPFPSASNGLSLSTKEGHSGSSSSAGRSVADLMMNGYAHQSQHYNKYSQMLLQQDLDLRQQQQSHLGHGRRARGHGHGHHGSSGGGGLGHGQEPYNIIKSEKRPSGSQSNSPPQTQFLSDVKPENLATGSQAFQLPLPLLSSAASSSSPPPSPANTSTAATAAASAALSRSLSNALLNLASLGNLAALQQQQAQASSNNGLSVPLNLTNTNGNSASMHQNRAAAPSPPPPASSSYLAQLISQHQLNFQQQQSMNMNMNAAAAQNLLNPGAGSSPGASSGGVGMPQLILASGSIVQGIQGAQLLIPSPQGLMTQTILTIPISSPGSPPSATNLPSPPIRGSSGSASRKNNGHHSSSTHPKLHPHAAHAHGPPRSPSPTQLLPRPPSSSRGSASASPNDLALLNLAVPSSSGSAHAHSQHQHLVNRHHTRMGTSEQLGGSQSRASPIPGLNSQLNSVANFASDRQGQGERHAVSQQQSAAISCVVNGPSTKREPSSTAVPANQLISSLIPVNSPGGRSSAYGASKLSPHSLAMLMEQDEDEERLDEEAHDSDYDKCSFNDDDDDDGEMIEGINLDEIKEFAKAFKLRRLSLGLTQTQVGQALSVTEGPSYSQSAICSALAWQLAQSQSQSQQLQTGRNRSGNPQSSVMFEKLDITPKSAQKIKPVLERWMKEAEDRYRNGHQNLNDFVGMEPSKKRKRRTSFTPQALEILNVHFERNTHPSGAEITTLAHQLGYEREVIRIWFCNKRQALKNTVRMMSKGGSPM